jgi:hypothetical protein
MIVKAKLADGLPLWAMKTGYILPQTGVTDINLGPSGDHATLAYNQTTTTASAILGASTIVVSSTTGFTSTYNIGIELSNSTIQWTTINGAPAGSTITLTATLTAAVASGAQVYVYQTKLQRPLRIVDAYVQNRASSTSPNEHRINIVSISDFKALGNHSDASVPNQISYDPQLVNGIVSVYPRFLTGDNLIQIRFHRPFEDFDASADTPDFPQEYYLALMVILAKYLAPKNGIPLDERRTLDGEADAVWEQAMSNGSEESSVYLMPTRYK